MNRSEDRVKRRNGVFGRWLGAAVLAAPLIIIGSLPAAAATQTIEVSSAAGNDDAEQRANGSVTLTSSDLELVAENGAAQTVGMRFANINVPPGAAIVSAEIQFTVDEATSGATALTFRAEATDNASVFTTTANSITARPVTTASAPLQSRCRAEPARPFPDSLSTC